MWAVALLVAATSLDVPFLPQTDRLCGGAALAMVFRYWGDVHTSVQEFSPLVDPLAGGIGTRVMIEEARRRGWTAMPALGSIETLRDAIHQGHPAIVLLQDRPHRYHFVVVVGADQEHVVIHDPAWGPSRSLPVRQFTKAWAPTDNWSLLILPPDGKRERPDATVPPREMPPTTDRCEHLVGEAIAEGGGPNPLAAIESRLLRIRQQCESSPAPLRELAGVRFAQRRWGDAEAFAEQAITLHDTASYTSDLLASSRYLQNDLEGALGAWNQIGKPRVDLVHVAGLRRTRYPLLIDELRLPMNTLLKPDDLRAAQRRLAEWPGLSGTRIGFTPEGDDYATVDVAVAEKSAVPGNGSEWLSASASAAVNREVRVEIPGTTGQAEVWSARWRWWTHRPAVSFEFLAPRARPIPGIWRVGGGWETESYALTHFETTSATTVHSRVHGELSVSDWIIPDMRYSVTVGLSSWDGSRRAVSVAASLERRFVGDRLALEGDAAHWIAIGSGSPFQTGRVRVNTRSSELPARWRVLAEIGLDAVSKDAPLTEWVGAGEGHAREVLLRAHPLLEDGVITGSTFGRYLAHANGELQRWFDLRRSPRIGIAMFVDLAESSGRLRPSSTSPFQIDVGFGARIRTPGSRGALRADVGQGLRDRRWALTIGWQR